MNYCSFSYFVTLILIIAVFIHVSEGKLWALLVSGGSRWWEYRRQADVCNMYQLLHSNGVPDENIIVMMKDDIAYDFIHNPSPGVIWHETDGPNVYDNVPLDYTERNLTKKNFFGVLTGKNGSLEGSGKFIDSDPENVILIYISSMNSGSMLWLDTSEYLYNVELFQVLQQMRTNKQFRKMLIIVDCPYGSTFFRTMPQNLHVLVITSTIDSRDLECNYDSILHTNLASCFGHLWSRLVKMIGVRKNMDIETVFDYFQLSRYLTNKSVMNPQIPAMFGHFEMGHSKISDFFGHSPTTVDRQDAYNISMTF